MFSSSEKLRRVALVFFCPKLSLVCSADLQRKEAGESELFCSSI